MLEVQVYDADGKAKEKLSFDESVFGDKVKSRTLREVIIAYEANRRQGTNNTLNLSDVAGSNKKPWRQKGTGRARTGQKRAPHRHKGSVAHGPHPRSFRVRIPAKMKRLALESALLAKFKAGDVVVVDGLSFDKPKTAKLTKMLRTSGLDKSSLLLGLDKEDRNFYLSARNVPRSLIRQVGQFNALEVSRQRRVLLTREAFDAIKGGLDKIEKTQSTEKPAKKVAKKADKAEKKPAKKTEKKPAKKAAKKD